MACLLASATALHAQQLVINEIQVANIDQWIDPSYNYGGWVELYNPSAEDIGLAGYVLRHTDADGLSTTHTLTYEHGVVPARGVQSGVVRPQQQGRLLWSVRLGADTL